MWKGFIIKTCLLFIYVKIDSTTFCRTSTDFYIRQAVFQHLHGFNIYTVTLGTLHTSYEPPFLNYKIRTPPQFSKGSIKFFKKPVSCAEYWARHGVIH